ncbi:SDR family NAD(P)-dependent oxidoreductase [Rhodococcus wratislaviensis]|uniref:SDR family NAD(P)-dependent oxidoreductase n=1 Tax=Rhodococcus wratislaviensis TaxID=44752 RepID=UPI001788D40A|nr:SDR family NAD(P)-dependent oxidoreductase [Rhodococcus wratislaviensis]
MAKTVLVTGASSGLGEALVVAFADAGWNVAATMRNLAIFRTPSKAAPAMISRRLRLPSSLHRRLVTMNKRSSGEWIGGSSACRGEVKYLEIPQYV